MKVLLLLLVSLLFCCQSKESYGQNLVPNPGFDNYIVCPNGARQVYRCVSWSDFGMSPDYWGSCAPNLSLPDIVFGYQYPHSFGCIMGLATWGISTLPANLREIIGAPLITPTVIG